MSFTCLALARGKKLPAALRSISLFANISGYTFTYAYDTLGNLATVTDTLGNVTTMQYDKLSRKTMMIDPDMGAWTYTYDNGGNLTRQTDARGQRICFYYDALNRLTGKHYRNDDACPTSNPSLNVTYTYDAFTSGVNYGKGRRTGMTMSDNSSSASWVYDGRGRVTQENKTIAGQSFTTGYTYDSLDRVVTTTYPDNEVVRNTYNAAGQPATLRSTTYGYNYVSSATYTALGQPWERTYGNAVKTTYDYYDTATEIDPETNRAYSFHLRNLALSGGTVTMNLSYRYDVVGNVQNIIDNLDGAKSQSFDYDPLDRLLYGSGVYGVKYYTYDTIGNLTCKDGTASPCSNGRNYQYWYLANGVYYTTTTGARTHRVYNDGVYTYEYDANGSVLTRKVNGAVERTFVYNGENQLTDVRNSANLSLQSNLYDGDGARMKTVSGGKTTYTFNAFYERETGGYGLDFDGVDDYVTIPHSSSNGGFNAQITLEAWIRPDGYPGGGGDGNSTIVTKAGAYYLSLDTTGHLQFYWYGLSNPGYHKSPNVIPTNQWTHVAATYDGSKVRLYENGVQVKEVTVTGNGTTNASAVEIGRQSTTRHFNGWMDEVRILNRALSAAELREDYSLRGYYVSRHGTAAWYHLDEGSGTSVTDASGNANTGTRSGAAWVAGMGGSGSSVTITKYYYFNGERIALRDSAGLKYLHADHLGSASKMSCGDTTCGTVGAQARALWYDPWGAVAADNGAASVRYQYTGQAHDATGLYFYNARYYDPYLNRFIQADSIVPGAASGSGGGAATLGYDSNTRLTPLTVNLGEFAAQVNAENREVLQFGAFFQWNSKTRQEHNVPMGPGNPQALNRYAYCLNNPLRYVDPTGHWQVGQIELSAEQSQQLIDLLDTLGDVDHWTNLADWAATVGIPLAALAGIQVPGVVSVESIMLITGVTQPVAALLLAVVLAVPAADMAITMHDCGELHEALLETRAGEYGATISMHQVFGFFKISVKTAYSEASFKTAVIGPIGSAVPGILGATMIYNRLDQRNGYTIYLPYVAR